MKKNRCSTILCTGIIAALVIVFTGAARAAPFTLSNAAGDGTVTVGVDGFGTFGSSIGLNATNPVYDPLGAIGPRGTAFESGIAIRFGSSGTRIFLTSGDIGGSGGLSNPTVTGTILSGSSAFILDGLNFALVQTLEPLFTGSVRNGSILIQTYNITNTSTSSLGFELMRYLDGDLGFDGTLFSDGGGRLFSGSTEILLETDSATGPATTTNFVGITATGGTIPAVGRYEIDVFSGLRSKIITGAALDNSIAGDGGDADQFIDAGGAYDVTLAFNNTFSLAAGASVTYTTSTIFATGAPETIISAPSGVPDGGSSLVLLGLGLGVIAWLRRK